MKKKAGTSEKRKVTSEGGTWLKEFWLFVAAEEAIGIQY
jgi:hypothetical protein